MARTPVELICAKRDGQALGKDEIARVIESFMAGQIADYQMSALLMAIFFRGMSEDEMVALTEAMLHSGSVLDLGDVPGVKVDKHSTGGVGDKVSLCLAPLVAACGVFVPMVSGRGLGHTGGTLDKLEAIPGFRTDLPTKDFARIVRDVGTCMIGQTAEIAPADKRIYALRDVTGTVESVPLIVASILSKKLAEGIDGLVLDVKVGRGAFMKDEGEARRLASALVRTGTAAGKKVVAVLTDMSAPLGRAVGNAIETREALELLHGRGPEDLLECTLVLGAEMLVMGNKARSLEEGRELLGAAIPSGRAAAVMRRMVEAQGGDARAVDDPDRLALASCVVVASVSAGTVTGIDALEVGLAAVAMGAGRTQVGQAIDPSVGIEIVAPRGARVSKGDALARLYVKGDAKDVVARVRAAFTVEERSPSSPLPPRPLVLGRVTA